MQPTHLLTLFSLLLVGAAHAQTKFWSCTCVTNGVVALKLMANCCTSVSGNINGDDCHIVGEQDASKGLTGEFLQCCLNGGQGAGCTP
ncbi:hypothetical protein R3P38DRAFT_3182696 [Favolaschia claudopus]|uniref:Uncharacterized protein n=1 Tax=Favolaschia claudopus TaxID=2862362 RepID=A0AAW0CGL6_9AGAR